MLIAMDITLNAVTVKLRQIDLNIFISLSLLGAEKMVFRAIIIGIILNEFLTIFVTQVTLYLTEWIDNCY